MIARRVVAALVLLASAVAVAAADSRQPSEASPTAVLGPPRLTEGSHDVRPDGVVATLDSYRRSLEVRAAFLVENAAPGPNTVELDAPTTGVRATWDGARVELERTGAPCANPPATDEWGMDPRSGKRYHLASLPPEPCERRRVAVVVGPSGRGRLVVEHALSAGYDRQRRRRQFLETAYLHKQRKDYFVYHFSVRGPGGPVTFDAPPHTDSKWQRDGDLHRFSAAERRRFPVGLVAAVGTAADPAGVKLALRGTLDVLLPWGDAVAFGADGDTDGKNLRLSGSLTYQYFARWMAFWPLGAHVEAGGVLDVYPRPRVGARAGIGGHFAWIQTQVLVDVFLDEPRWRVTVVTGIGF